MARKRKKKRGASATAERTTDDSPAAAAPHAAAAPAVPAPAAPAPAAPAPAAPAPAVPVPGDRHRHAANVFIALFLLYSVAMPARYYLTGGGTDERFAWRMFSTVRQYSCTVTTTETLPGSRARRKVALEEDLHAAWINMLKRGRKRLDERFLHAHCARGDAETVRMVRACLAPDGSELPRVRYDIDCKSGALEMKRGTEGPS